MTKTLIHPHLRLSLALLTLCAAAFTLTLSPALADELEEPVPVRVDREDIRRMPSRMPMPYPDIAAFALRDDAGLVRVNGDHDLFIGTLTRAEPGHPGHPSDYCLDDDKLWTGADFRMGDLPIFGLLPSKRVSDSAGGTVLIAGERKRSIDDVITEAGPCPPKYGEPWRMMQWRDDWTAPEGQHAAFLGPDEPRTNPWSHARLKSLSYLDATSVEPLRVVHVEVITKKGGAQTAAVTVHNVFDQPLTLPLSLHYEGGGGKPSPRYEQVELKIAPGEQHTFTASLSISDAPPKTKAARSGEFRLQSVELRGTIGRATIDIKHPIP